jgi:hypothetical protein
VFFELAESTLLVEALRVDEQLKATVGCSHCGKSSGYVPPPSQQKRSMLPPFGGSFDFVPLEERTGNDPFRNNNSSGSASQRRVTNKESGRASVDITSSYTSPSTPDKAAVPLDTLSRSLVDHPEWNNNDYRMF